MRKDGFASSHGGGGSKGERAGGLLSPKLLPRQASLLLCWRVRPSRGPPRRQIPEAPARGRAALVSKARTVWMSLRQSSDEVPGERSESEL